MKIFTRGPKEGELVLLDASGDTPTLLDEQKSGGTSTTASAATDAVTTQGISVTERVKDIDRKIGDCSEGVCNGEYEHVQSGLSVEFTKPAQAIGDASLTAAIEALILQYVSGPIGWGAGFIAGILITLGGDTFTISPYDDDERGDVLFWKSEPVIDLGVSTSWNSYPGGLTEFKEEDGEHLADYC